MQQILNIAERKESKIAKDLEEYIGLINMRLVDISIDIQELSSVLNKLGKELEQISVKIK